jgi:hypothetical protein
MFDQMIDRIAAQNLDSLALEDFRDRGAKLHGRFSPFVVPSVGPD